MERVLNTITNCHGNEIPAAILIQEDGMLRLWEINCYSSQFHGLGNCLCINHHPSEEYPISTDEVIARFGIEALDGFEAPSREQLVFDAFGVEVHELETYFKVSYQIGINPLPEMRRSYNLPIVFGEDPDRLVFPEEEPGTIIFIVNSRGEIAVRKA